MSIERGIRAFSLNSVRNSEDVLAERDGNIDLGYLDTSSHPGKNQDLFFKIASLPDIITLRAKVIPVPGERTNVFFQAVVNGEYTKKTNYYGEEILPVHSRGHVLFSQYQAIDLVFTGQGSFLMEGENRPLSWADFHVQMDQGYCLIRKKFILQDRPLLLYRRTSIVSNKWLNTPPYGSAGKINSHPLMAYGGYFKKGLPIDQICQTFAVPVCKDSGRLPYLIIQGQSDLEKRRLPPPQEGLLDDIKHHYIDTFQKETLLSLAGLVETGEAKILISLKDLEEPVLYQSFHYTQSDPQSGFVDLSFKKGRTV